MPDWLAQAAALAWRILVVVAFGAVALYVGTILGTVIASVVLAAAVVAAFDPLADRLRAGGGSNVRAAAIVTLTGAGLAVLVIAVAAIAFVPATVQILRALNAGLDSIQKALESGSLQPPVSTLAEELVNGVTGWVSSAATSVVSHLATGATILLLSVFLLFFLVIDADRAIGWVLQSTAPWQHALIEDKVATARLRVGRALRETAARATIMGGVTLVAAAVLGLPVPLALAVLVFVGGFVPLLGPVATVAGVGLVALGTSGGLAAIAIVGLLAATPLVLARLPGPNRWSGHGVHPAVILVALTVGAVVAGLLGLVLAVPVVMLIGVVAPGVIAALNGSPDQGTAEGIVPRWLDRIAQWSWRLLVLSAIAMLALGVITQVPLILIPFVFAAVAAATLAPGLAVMRRRRFAPTTSALTLTVGGFGLVLLILAITLAALAGPGSDIVQQASSGGGKIDDFLTSGQSIASIVAAIGPQLVQAIGTLVAGLAGLTISIALGAILTFYLLRDGPDGFEAVTRPLSSWRHDELRDAAGRATGILGGYMIGTGAVSAVGAASQFLVMWLLGIPLAWPLAILSFFGGFIPYIGSLLTTGLAFLVTVSVGTPQDVLVMALFTVVFNIVQGNVVAPLVYSRAVSIHPAIVLLAVPAGSALAGLAGMFLAVPVIGIVATTWRTVLRVFGQEPSDRAGAAEDGAGARSEPAAAAGAAVVPLGEAAPPAEAGA